jgi:uncharacterized protein YukE
MTMKYSLAIGLLVVLLLALAGCGLQGEVTIMTDAQMSVLSNLAYADLPSGMSLSEFARTRGNSLPDKYQSAIAAINRDPHGLGALTIGRQSSNPNTGFSATLFTTRDNNAVVAFQGTQVGLNADTRSVLSTSHVTLTTQQRDALNFMDNYVHGRGFGDVAVTGHSQGGQLANTVAVLHDGVSRSVAYDPVGFSDAFLRNHRNDIEARSGNVTSYTREGDRVVGTDRWVSSGHLLGNNDLPGSTNIRMTRRGYDPLNHSIEDWVGYHSRTINRENAAQEAAFAIANAEYNVIDTGSFNAVINIREQLNDEYKKIETDYERIVGRILANWTGKGADAFMSDAAKVRTNIKCISVVLGDMCDTLRDAHEMIETTDKLIGEANRNPF